MTVVQPQPVPVSIGIEVLNNVRPRLIQMAFYNPCGLSVFFIDAEQAEKIAKLLRDKAREAKLGLLIPVKKGDV